MMPTASSVRMLPDGSPKASFALLRFSAPKTMAVKVSVAVMTTSRPMNQNADVSVLPYGPSRPPETMATQTASKMPPNRTVR